MIDAQLSRRNALLVLLLTVPASTIGVLISTIIAPGSLGQGLFSMLKFWLVALPVYWTLKVDRQRLRLPKPTLPQVGWGIGIGLLMFGIILGVYGLFGVQWIDLAEIRVKATEVGIVSPFVLFVGAVYWCLVNSFIEEAVWRSFIFRKWAVLVPASAAVWLMGLCFTLHHTLALWVYTQDLRATVLGSIGVFSASIIWSICYRRSNSLWPGYISHILADVAIVIVGYDLLFS